MKGVKYLNDNLLIHLYSSLVKYEGKIKVLEHKLDRQEKELRKLAEEKEKIKSDHTQNIYKMKSDIAEEINKIGSKNTEIMKIEEKHTEEIKMLNKSLTTKQPITPIVGFHVALSKNWVGSEKVPFDKILSNYGSGWNSITHTFKVPRKGLYLLILTVIY